MSSSDDKPNAAAKKKSAGRDSGKDANPAPRGQDMGQALRSVYQRTVEESVPDEMMDLLGKLG